VTERAQRSTLRIGLAGAGMIGRFRVRALEKIPGAELVAVADPDETLARRLIGSRDLRLVSDGAAFADDAGVDAVIVSTPPAAHESIGVACLQAGKHVLCEKPLAMSVTACEALVHAAEAGGARLATGFTLRHTPAARLARQLVDSGSIGDVDHVRAYHGHAGGNDFGPGWIVDEAVSGGGTLMDNGIHMIDLARWFLGGNVRAMTGYATGHVWQKPGCEDNGFVLMRNEKDRIASVHSSWSEWRGYGYRVEIYGTRGAVRFGYAPLWLAHTSGKPGGRMKTRRHFFPRYQVIERLKGWEWSLVETLVADLEDWIAAIRSGGIPSAGGEDGLAAVRIAHGVERLGRVP
jgi:predicted dehydrogenase